MSLQEKPTKAVISVVEMASMVGLSKSRFYALMEAGVFPRPVQNGKRPAFDFDLQAQCLSIKKTGIGANGQPVLFNRKHKKNGPKARQSRQQATSDHTEKVEALKSLGLATTAGAVQGALDELYPDGCEGIDQGEIIRRVFLHLHMRK